MKNASAVLLLLFLLKPHCLGGMVQYQFGATIAKSQIADTLQLHGATFAATYIYDNVAGPVAWEETGSEPSWSEFSTVAAILEFKNRPGGAADILIDTRVDSFRTDSILSNRLRGFNQYSQGVPDVAEFRNFFAAGSIFDAVDEVAIGSIGIRFNHNDIFEGIEYPKTPPAFTTSDIKEVIYTNTFIDLHDEGRTARYTLHDTFASGSNAVPEPTSTALWTFSGCLGFVIARRRKRMIAA